MHKQKQRSFTIIGVHSSLSTGVELQLTNAFLSFFSVHRDILDFLKLRSAAVESDLLTVIFSVGPMSLIFLPKGFDYVIFL